MKKRVFDQTKYINKWTKENKKRFVVDLKISEFNELEKLLKEKRLTKAQFLRDAIKILKNK